MVEYSFLAGKVDMEKFMLALGEDNLVTEIKQPNSYLPPDLHDKDMFV